MKSLFALAALALPLSACQAQPQAAAAPASAESQANPGLPKTSLTIVGAAGTQRFTVEVAGTVEQQATGMMFRTSAPRGTGMLFPFAEPRMASFWMKNTLIPLDLIFIKADGTISNIADNAVPQSTDMILSTEPVTAVLELAGGEAASLGISPGDKVSWAPPGR